MTVSIDLDISSTLGSARDQGQRPTCIAFATSDLHAATRSATFVPLSCEYLYYHACRSTASFDSQSGVTLTQILEALERDGQPEETQWPYLKQVPSDLTAYRAPQVAGPIYRRGSTVITSNPVDRITTRLQSNRGAMLVFRYTIQFVRAQVKRPVTWSMLDPKLRLHAVIAVGLGQFDGERCVKVRNSWGMGWADAGHAWLSESYVSNTFVALVEMV